MVTKYNDIPEIVVVFTYFGPPISFNANCFNESTHPSASIGNKTRPVPSDPIF